MAEDELEVEPGIFSARARDLAKKVAIGGVVAALFYGRKSGRLDRSGLNRERYTYDRASRPQLQPAIVNTTYTDVNGIPGGVYNDELIYPGDPDYFLKPGDPHYGEPIVRVRMGFS